MSKKTSKKETKAQIKEFFESIIEKTPEEVKKIKKLAMNQNIKLGDKRKLFCKKCLAPYKNSSVLFKDNFLTITCSNCDYKNRWKVKGDINFGITIESRECC